MNPLYHYTFFTIASEYDRKLFGSTVEADLKESDDLHSAWPCSPFPSAAPPLLTKVTLESWFIVFSDIDPPGGSMSLPARFSQSGARSSSL